MQDRKITDQKGLNKRWNRSKSRRGCYLARHFPGMHFSWLLVSLKTSYVRSFAVGVCVCLSDRYKVFVDLLDMSTYVVPRQYTPQLTQRVRRNLSVAAIGQQPPDELPFDDDDDDDLTSSSNLAKLLIY